MCLCGYLASCCSSAASLPANMFNNTASINQCSDFQHLAPNARLLVLLACGRLSPAFSPPLAPSLSGPETACLNWGRYVLFILGILKKIIHKLIRTCWHREIC